MVDTDDGIVTFFNDEHFMNVKDSIDLIVGGISISESDSQLKNA